MSRRSQIVQSQAAAAGSARTRSLEADWIYCDGISGGSTGEGDTIIGSLPIEVITNYRRVFLSATVWGIDLDGGGA